MQWISDCIAGGRSNARTTCSRSTATAAVVSSLADTSLAHGPGQARSVDVLGADPLISEYQEKS